MRKCEEEVTANNGLTVFELTECSGQQVSMRVLAEDYAYSLTDQVTFQIYALARIPETDQLFVDCVDFCLARPMLEIEVSQISLNLVQNDRLRILYSQVCLSTA